MTALYVPGDPQGLIFDIDTFGGRVDSALQITSLIGSAIDETTIAYVPSSAEGTATTLKFLPRVSTAERRAFRISR